MLQRVSQYVPQKVSHMNQIVQQLIFSIGCNEGSTFMLQTAGQEQLPWPPRLQPCMPPLLSGRRPLRKQQQLLLLQ